MSSHKYVLCDIGDDQFSLLSDDSYEFVFTPDDEGFYKVELFSDQNRFMASTTENAPLEEILISIPLLFSEIFIPHINFTDKESEWFKQAEKEDLTNKQVDFLYKNQIPFIIPSKEKDVPPLYISKAQAMYQINTIVARYRKQSRLKSPRH